MALGEGWHRHRDRRTDADELHVHGGTWEPGHEHPIGDLPGRLDLGPAEALTDEERNRR